jgi:hypothetical protein
MQDCRRVLRPLFTLLLYLIKPENLTTQDDRSIICRIKNFRI